MREFARLASFCAPGIRSIERSVVHAARVLALCTLMGSLLVGSSAAQVAAQTASPFPELRSLVLTGTDLPGFSVDPTRTTLNDKPDGSGTYDAVFVRDAAAPPGTSEIRLAVARTGSGMESLQSLAATRESLLAAGWSIRPVPLLGDEAIGFEAAEGTVVSAGNVSYGYIFRFGRHLIASFVAGTPTSTSFDQALGYSVKMSARLDAALAAKPVPDPQPAPAGTILASTNPAPAPVASTSPETTPPAAQQATTPPAATAQQAAPPPPAAQQQPTTAQQQATTAQQQAPVQAAARQSVRVPTVVADVRLNNAPELQNGFKIGGFSGLVATDSSGTAFVTTTDRGPNGEIKVNGATEMAFPLPKYTPRLVRLRLEGDRLQIADTILLKLPEGFIDPITKSREITGLPPFEESGDEAYSPDGKQAYGTDPNGVDTESLALDSRDGSFWLGEEYGPSILHVAADGTILMRIVPRGRVMDAPGQNVRELLPEAVTMRRVNRGFEGLTISPDGTRLFAMLQSPLANPDAKTAESSRNIRIFVLDTSDAANPKLANVYVYQTQPYGETSAKKQDNIKIGDIAAISRTVLLVGERDSEEGGNYKTVYRVDLSKATDVSASDQFKGKTLEQATESDFRSAGVELVSKSLAVDLAKLGFRPDKFEGLALVDSTTIAVVNDNDFGIQSIDTRGRIVQQGQPPRLVVIRVPEPLQ